ncbi:MAG: hypothetical protein V9E90_00160 [Saprospiraceae bacterium]
MKSANSFNSRFLILCMVFLSLSTCTIDPVNPDQFKGPSEIRISILSGKFTGRNFDLISENHTDDHQFLLSKEINKVLIQPIQEDMGMNLETNSFVNWAWKGDTVTGTFLSVFANDPNVAKSGDLQLIYTNGDEFITAIPRDIQIAITNYSQPNGSIEGNFFFTNYLDYRFNGNSGRESVRFEISFKLVRGPNL